MELLLPAGDFEKLKIAVKYGADAVYCGLKRFNARNFAGNFDYNELKEGIFHAHENGVKVYVVFNTLIKDSEVEDFLKDINYAYNSYCDAIIIQDYWLVPLINKIWPDLDIHLSTQSFIVNSESLKFLKKLGKFSRIVLARELSLLEIKEIKYVAKELNIEIEIFGHGALCMCYSGQCLISSMIGGRSGNRGNCAQPCRKIYNQEYMLSTKDLCSIENLDKVISSEIDSLKIEGRMRSDLYLKIVCNVYRKYIDKITKENKSLEGNKNLESKETRLDFETKKELEIAFNRGFSNDYLLDNEKNDVQISNITGNVINSEKPINHGIYLGKVDNQGLIKIEYDIELNDAYSIWLENRTIGKIIEKIDIIKDSFGNDKNENDASSARIGETVRLSGIDISMDINRKIYLTRSQKIIKKYSSSDYVNTKDKINVERNIKEEDEIILPKLNKSKNKKDVSFLVNADNLKECNEIINLINLNSSNNNNFNLSLVVNLQNIDLLDIINQSNENNINIYVKTRNVVTDIKIKQDIKRIKELGLSNIIICNIGYLDKIKEIKTNLNLILNYNLNIFNSFDLDVLKENQLNCIISPELNFDELTQLKDKKFYTLIHGNLCVAKTRAEIIKEDEEILIDETEAEFRISKNNDENCFEIYNSKELGVFEFIANMIDNGVKNFYIERCDNVVDIVDKYIRVLNNNNISYDNTRYTFGHLKRGV
jgi:U32 family peptidase